MELGAIFTGIGAIGVVTGNGLILRFLWARTNEVKKDQKDSDKERKKELYQEDGQTNYVLRKEHNDHCKEVQQTFCKKVDETKELIRDMKSTIEKAEVKREGDLKDYHEGQLKIFERLAGIEAK